MKAILLTGLALLLVDILSAVHAGNVGFILPYFFGYLQISDLLLIVIPLSSMLVNNIHLDRLDSEGIRFHAFEVQQILAVIL